MSTLTESMPKEVTEDVLGEESNSGEPAQPQPQLPTVIPKKAFLAQPSAVHNMTATTSEVAGAQKRKRSSCSPRDKIDEMHLLVLTKESNKLDLEIENLLLQKEKLQLEIQHIKSRFYHEQ